MFRGSENIRDGKPPFGKCWLPFYQWSTEAFLFLLPGSLNKGGCFSCFSLAQVSMVTCWLGCDALLSGLGLEFLAFEMIR